MSFLTSVSRFALFAVVAAPAAVYPSPAAAAAAPARVQSVAIDNFAFAPQVIVVAPGTTVTWTNADDDPHTVVANDKSFHSPAMDTDDSYSFTFTRPGEYAYFCSLHPHMTGKVIVKG
jgi:plastocyanin